MKLVVGLGNPGSRYRGTRHNVGFLVVDRIAERWQVGFAGWRQIAAVARKHAGAGRQDVLLAKPLTFMNLSGDAVAELVRYYRLAIPDVLVVLDEAELPLGRVRIRPRGSDGGHNGLGSILDRLGTTAVPRLRIGVGRPGREQARDLKDHVLATFDRDEQPVVEEAVERAADAVDAVLHDGIAAAMNRYNRASPV